MPILAKILIYPIKALEPVCLSEARVLPSGALEGDRRFAIQDAQGKFMNGKRTSKVHRLRSCYDLKARTLRLGHDPREMSPPLHVDRDRRAINVWLSEFFEEPVTLQENLQGGFPDDPDCPGPTVISTETLMEVTSWFPGLKLEQVRVRFRANLEILGGGAFWEDRLYGPKPTRVPFRIGDVKFDGNNPCQRCAVPPRDPITGELYPDFVKIFMQNRERTLPPWAERSRFNHFYRLSINTLAQESQGGKVLRVGDPVIV